MAAVTEPGGCILASNNQSSRVEVLRWVSSARRTTTSSSSDRASVAASRRCVSSRRDTASGGFSRRAGATRTRISRRPAGISSVSCGPRSSAASASSAYTFCATASSSPRRVGGGSLNYANTLYKPPASFFEDKQWAHITDWHDELSPFYEQARRILGVVTNPHMTPADDVIKSVADDMGVGDTFIQTPVGVYFGGARPHRRRPPLLRWGGARPHRLHRMRRVHDRLPARREEHPGEELSRPREKAGARSSR